MGKKCNLSCKDCKLNQNIFLGGGMRGAAVHYMCNECNKLTTKLESYDDDLEDEIDRLEEEYKLDAKTSAPAPIPLKPCCRSCESTNLRVIDISIKDSECPICKGNHLKITEIGRWD